MLAKTSCRMPGRCRPPQGWADSSLDQSPGVLPSFRAERVDGFQRTGHCWQMQSTRDVFRDLTLRYVSNLSKQQLTATV